MKTKGKKTKTKVWFTFVNLPNASDRG